MKQAGGQKAKVVPPSYPIRHSAPWLPPPPHIPDTPPSTQQPDGTFQGTSLTLSLLCSTSPVTLLLPRLNPRFPAAQEAPTAPEPCFSSSLAPHLPSSQLGSKLLNLLCVLAEAILGPTPILLKCSSHLFSLGQLFSLQVSIPKSLLHEVPLEVVPPG